MRVLHHWNVRTDWVEKPVPKYPNAKLRGWLVSPSPAPDLDRDHPVQRSEACTVSGVISLSLMLEKGPVVPAFPRTWSRPPSLAHVSPHEILAAMASIIRHTIAPHPCHDSVLSELSRRRGCRADTNGDVNCALTSVAAKRARLGFPSGRTAASLMVALSVR